MTATTATTATTPTTAEAGLDPRVVRTRELVLAATRDALVEEGHAGVTVDGIARRSGVARTTIYRHWPELSDLLADAFESIKAEGEGEAGQPDTGDLGADMRRKLRGLRTALQTELWAHVLPTMIDGSVRRPELAGQQERLVCGRRQGSIDLVQRAVDRGQLPAGTDAEALVDRFVAPIFYRHLMSKKPITDAYIDELVDAVLIGAGAATEGRRTPTGRRRVRD